jgi:hypothetical protein
LIAPDQVRRAVADAADMARIAARGLFCRNTNLVATYALTRAFMIFKGSFCLGLLSVTKTCIR